MRFFNTFRGRLLVILSILLVATLGIQFYLNYLAQKENDELREMQEQALVAGMALGFNSMTSEYRLEEFINREGQPFFDEKITERIKDIIIINNEWQVYDSINPEYLPTTDENGEIKYLYLKDLKNLPPLMEGRSRLGNDIENFPNANTPQNIQSDREAHAIPIETDKGQYYVMVILKSDKNIAASKAAQQLIYTLLVLLLSTVITIYLVWRFTRPIANLSTAARRVAEGDLSVRVRDSERTDEMGRLASQFNEMTAQLEKSRELEAQLQEAEKSAVVGRLASAIAHEIRNPLNYINLTLDHLRSKFKPQEAENEATFEKLTNQLKREVERINHLVSDFLRYSRPVKLELEPIEARKIIEDSLRLIEPQAEEQNIRISLIERENVPQMLGDTDVLRSVFSNLFINAVQAMEKDGGNLNVIISPEENFVKIEIVDTGVGISEENLDKIFEPYFSTKETGTGLGLAIVKKLVEDHNGFIDVESKPGEGAKFIVKFPKV